MTRLNLMLGGPVEELPANWASLPGDWVGVDRGTLHLLNAGITPVFAVGDFDSLTAAEHARVLAAVADITAVQPEKDDTDTELAVQLALMDHHADAVTLVGATGGRLDHLLANLYVPAEARFQPYAAQISLVDHDNLAYFLAGGTRTFSPQAGYDYIGIVPLMGVTGLTITGGKYTLRDWSSQTPFAWASNEFVGDQPITVSLTAGVVAVIYSRDRRGQQVDN